MAHHKTDKLTWALVIALLFFGAGYVFMIVTGSTAVPGGTATIAVEEARDDLFMNLGAWSWTGVVLIATAILAIALIYSQYRTGKLSRAEFEEGERELRRAHRQNREN